MSAGHGRPGAPWPDLRTGRVPQASEEPSEPGQDLNPGAGGARECCKLDTGLLGGEECGGGSADQVPAGQAAVVAGAVQVEGSLTSTLFPIYWDRFSWPSIKGLLGSP